MAEKLLQTSSAEDIVASLRSADIFISDNDGDENESRLMASSVSSQKSAKKPPSAKSSRTSSTKPRKESADKRIDGLEKKMDERFDSIFQLLQTLKPNEKQDTGGSACQIPVSLPQDDRPLGVSGPVSDVNGPSGRRTHLPLGNFESAHHEISDDVISLMPGQREKDSLGLLSDNEEIRSVSSAGTVSSGFDNRKSNRFCQYLAEKPLDATQNMLCELFGEDAGPKQTSENGLCLDQSQIDILLKSWRSSNPERLSAYKDEYRTVFPVHDSSESVLKVPSLDDLLEPMLCKQHGSKSVKSWGKSRQLATQPLKSIESVAYQGQVAARYGIISVAYMQQALGTLLNKLQSAESNIDSAIQSVRDIFAMSTKALDQVGRTGAFHHVIRRKAAASDTGLNNFKEVQAKVLYLPLSDEGVFGKGLEDSLKKRKEQREHLSDLVPDFGDPRSDRKRKFSYDTRSWKRPRGDTTVSRPFRTTVRPSATVTHTQSRFQDDRRSDFRGRSTKEAASSFRIPFKNRK